MKYRLSFSKYDIKYRNELGHYLRDDWTSIWDVGKVCEGVLVTLEEYERVESQYLKTLEEIVKLLDIDSFRIRDVDYYDNEFSDLGFPVKVGATVTIEQFLILAKLILREELWVSFEHPDIWVNFVDDYYVFLGFNRNLDGVKRIVKANHLFWEKEKTVFFDE
ncbi:hypothetical protein [Streptococcus halotolerans]|uniref:hypothetical protein n=1 Tax=Streptococcus halotolerans TaxID=1814128 RepID=UPI000787534B|nr:hypothetical protein [Streptococcus halotolerans]